MKLTAGILTLIQVALLLSLSGTFPPSATFENVLDLYCEPGMQMEGAEYESGIDEPAPCWARLDTGFQVIVRPEFTAHNFVSNREHYYRSRAAAYQIEELMWGEVRETSSCEERKKDTFHIREMYRFAADSLHAQNNQGQQQVWLINNSSQEISLPTKDGYYICVMQAKTLAGEWKPIEYCRLGGCSGRYHYKDLPPGFANSFVTSLPRKGNYATELRFKLLGDSCFHYSNVFRGRIDFCQFREFDPTLIGIPKEYWKVNPLYNFYVLDTLIHVRRRM